MPPVVLLFILAMLLASPSPTTNAFVVVQRGARTAAKSWFDHRGSSARVACQAKRKKRGQDREDDNGGSDLPDFDVKDANDVAGSEPPTSSAMAPPAKSRGDGPSTVSAAMMGSPVSDAKSVRELLGDRSLERKMVFDEPNNGDSPPLPDLVQLAKQQRDSTATRTSASSAGKKRKRGSPPTSIPKDEGESVLSRIPFILNEKGELSPQKVVEAGTWLGIALLLIWEVYINTPFFDRAAPMAPVVY